MKKGIIVLLIMALVAGYAFAGFSGSAEIGYKFNLDNQDNGIYNKQTTDYKFTFTLDEAVGESKGEGKVYAEIAAEASAVITEDAAVTVEAEITKANIVAGDVVVDILGPKGAYNYASSYYKNAAGKKAQYDFANAYKVANGFVVSYKDFAVSFAYDNSSVAAVKPEYGWVDDDDDPTTPDVWGVTNTPAAAKPAKVDLFAGVETPNFEVADGLKVQAAANYHLVGEKSAFGGAAKASYTNKDIKVKASVAADVEYTAAKELPVDASATVTYDFISASVYFGTTDSFKKNTNYLSAKVDAKYTIDAVTVSCYGEVRDAIKLQKPWFLAGAKASFKAEQFACYAGVDASIKDGKLAKATYGKTKYAGLGVSAGISSDALISNCTVALDWAGSDFSGNTAVLGAITASAKVAF